MLMKPLTTKYYATEVKSPIITAWCLYLFVLHVPKLNLQKRYKHTVDDSTVTIPCWEHGKTCLKLNLRPLEDLINQYN